MWRYFNGKCGDMPDYIDEDVNTTSDRNVVDMTRNVYGELCNFLISASMCMMNGRKYVVNDVTCKIASLVYYVFLTYEQLYVHSRFSMKLVNDLFYLAGCVGLYDPVRYLPDHNMIQWNMDLIQYMQSELTTEELPGNTGSDTYVKYDVSDILEALLQDNSTQRMLH